MGAFIRGDLDIALAAIQKDCSDPGEAKGGLVQLLTKGVEYGGAVRGWYLEARDKDAGKSSEQPKQEVKH